ncbi:MAG: ABC transporter substrate-binding protein [Betaproteobacteria bacterium]|jgi:branched-chain amino acid transport system substrate-binding protein
MTFKAVRTLAAAAGVVAALAGAGSALAQAKEQFVPVLVYRTGPYAPNGTPWANGFVDYLKLVTARDGGIGGVKIIWEECETGYATDRGVECYERLKGKGPTGAAAFNPLSTGITFALTDKALVDKIPIVTMGYGRSESADGEAFPYNFPLLGSYWVAADILVQHLGKVNGGLDKLKGKKIALVYHDSPFGREPIPLLQERSKMHGFELTTLPVTHPGVEQKAAWLQIRQNRPDYVLLWGWGVMNAAAIREAVATGFPRDRMYGVWWAGAEPDVTPVGADAKGYHALTLQHGAGISKVHQEILKHVHDKGQGTGPKDEVGQVLYTRGMMNAMLVVEGIKRAQDRYGKKPLKGEEVRWGLENLTLTQDKLDALGFAGVMRPVTTVCRDHQGSQWGRVHTWDGGKWNFSSDWYEADMSILRPMIRKTADAYLAEKKLTRRDCAADVAAQGAAAKK